MDFDRNSMTVPVQSSDYTKKFLQKGSNPTTMEVVTQIITPRENAGFAERPHRGHNTSRA